MGFYTESARRMINPMDVPTFMIECAEAERKLFEGLIELDFAEVYKENGLAVFTEADEAAADETSKKAIGDVINTIVTKFQEALGNAYKAITEKLKEFFDKTTEFLSKKVLDDSKAAKCDTPVIWYQTYYDKCIEGLKSAESELDKINSDAAKGEGFADKITNIYDEITGNISKIPFKKSDDMPEEYKGMVSKVSEHNVKDLTKALSPAGIGSELTGVYNKLKAIDLSHYKIEEGDTKDVQDRKTNVLRQVTKVKLAYFAARAKIAMNTATAARNNYATIASYVKGGKKEEVQNNSAIYTAMSDMLCESIFEI